MTLFNPAGAPHCLDGLTGTAPQSFASLAECLSLAFTGREINERIVLPPVILMMSAQCWSPSNTQPCEPFWATHRRQKLGSLKR